MRSLAHTLRAKCEHVRQCQAALGNLEEVDALCRVLLAVGIASAAVPGRRLRSRASAPECQARPLLCTALVGLMGARAAPAQPRLRARVPGAPAAMHSISRLDRCVGGACAAVHPRPSARRARCHAQCRPLALIGARAWRAIGRMQAEFIASQEGMLHCWLGQSQANGLLACSPASTPLLADVMRWKEEPCCRAETST